MIIRVDYVTVWEAVNKELLVWTYDDSLDRIEDRWLTDILNVDTDI